MGRRSLGFIYAEQSYKAAQVAIGSYNQPQGIYRKEAFIILMTNAWELLIKGKIIKYHNNINSIYVRDKNAKTKSGKPYKNQPFIKLKCGNYKTLGFSDIIDTLEDANLKRQLSVLYQIRNSVTHSVSHTSNSFEKDFLQVATATIRSYVFCTDEWFQHSITSDFPLIPLAFNIPSHFEASEKDTNAKLLQFIHLNHDSIDKNSPHQIFIEANVKFNRTSKKGVLVHQARQEGLSITQDTEETFCNKYPWSYQRLIEQLKKKYSNFKQDAKFHKVKKEIENKRDYCGTRYLDPNTKKSISKKFYSSNILQEFHGKLNFKEKIYEKPRPSLAAKTP